MQLLVNDMRVFRDGDAKDEFTDEEYGELYAHLQHEDRIWDFRDLFYGNMATAPIEKAIHCLFNKYLSPQNQNALEVVQIIQKHWSGSAEDEVTSLALLDIFTALSIWALDTANERYEDSVDDSEELQTAKIYLDTAHHYATEVLHQNPLNLKSRSYLQWVIAKVLVEKNTYPARCGETALTRYLYNLRGATLVSTGAFRGLLPFRDIVVYTPNHDEAPNWQPDASVTFSHVQEKAIQMVARNARELGDVLLEAACLQQLSYSFPNTEVYLVDLCNLWRSKGNRLGLLRAYLHRYILKRTTDARNDLRIDLLEFGDTQCRVSLQKARFMILRALSTRSYEKEAYLKRAQDLNNEPHRSTYNEWMPPLPRHIETIYSAQNNGRQAGSHYGEYYSDDIVPSDDDDANNNGPLSVRNQQPGPHNVRRTTRNDEYSFQKNELERFNKQNLRKRITATAFNDADQMEMMPSEPATNMLPIRRDSVQISKDFDEHGDKTIVRPDSRKTTKGSRDLGSSVDLVNDQNKQQHGEERQG